MSTEERFNFARVAWMHAKQCGLCGSTEIDKGFDLSRRRYTIRCMVMPKPPAKTKAKGADETAANASMSCGWNVSFSKLYAPECKERIPHQDDEGEGDVLEKKDAPSIKKKRKRKQ